MKTLNSKMSNQIDRVSTHLRLLGLLALVVTLILSSCGATVDEGSSDSGPDPTDVSASEKEEEEEEEEADSSTTLPATETTMDSAARERIEIAEQFMAAHQEHDAAAIQLLLDPDASILEFGFWRRTPTDYDGLFQWTEILDWDWHLDQCAQATDAKPDRINCTFDIENVWSRAQGVDPVPGHFELLIEDGAITEVILERDSDWRMVVGHWREWLDQNHRGEIPILYRFDEEDRLTGGPATDPDAIALYEMRVPEYVAAITEAEADGG